MGAYLSLSGSGREVGWGGGGRLFEAGRLLTFSAFRMGAYSRWALVRSWALIRINTVFLEQHGDTASKDRFENERYISNDCMCSSNSLHGLWASKHLICTSARIKTN